MKLVQKPATETSDQGPFSLQIKNPGHNQDILPDTNLDNAY